MRVVLKRFNYRAKRVIFTLMGMVLLHAAHAQVGVRLEFDACVRNDTLFIDLFATDTVTGGTNFAFGGANFVFDIVDPATSVTSGSVAMGSQIKIDSLDGPWDNSGLPGTANGDYLDMNVNTGVNGFVNVTVVPDEADNLGIGPNTGFVMTDGVRYQIAQVALPVLVCADLVSLRWRTDVTHPFGGGGVINQWNNPGNDLRSQMNFVNLENVFLCNNLCASSLLDITGSDSVCGGVPEIYTLPQASNGDSVYWYVNGTQVQAGTINTFTYSPTGLDTITAEVANGTCLGCPNSVSNPLIISYFNPPISIDAGPDTTISPDTAIQLIVTDTNVVSYLWQPGTALSDSTISNPMANPQDTTEYVVFGYGGIPSCFATDTVVINVIPRDYSDLIVRNFMSPNGDPSNQYWTVNDTSIISGCDVRIYSRWGIAVYESLGYQNDWDGTSNGKPVSDGTYYYVITCDGFEKTGAITVVR